MSKRFKINLSREEITEDLTGTPAGSEVDSFATFDEVEEAVAQYEEEVLEGQQAEEAARIRDVATALEDIAEIADAIQAADAGEVTPERRALIQVAANMATAGTDADATELIPGAVEGPIDGDAIRQKAQDMRHIADSVAPAATETTAE